MSARPTDIQTDPWWLSLCSPLCAAFERRGNEHLKGFEFFLPEIQGQNLVMTVLYAPNSLDSGIMCGWKDLNQRIV